MRNFPSYPLLETLGTTPGGWSVGVLDTPCYPARYYGGVVLVVLEGGFPANTSTCHFYHTQAEAVEGAKKFLK